MKTRAPCILLLSLLVASTPLAQAMPLPADPLGTNPLCPPPPPPEEEPPQEPKEGEQPPPEEPPRCCMPPDLECIAAMVEEIKKKVGNAVGVHFCLGVAVNPETGQAHLDTQIGRSCSSPPPPGA